MRFFFDSILLMVNNQNELTRNAINCNRPHCLLRIVQYNEEFLW